MNKDNPLTNVILAIVVIAVLLFAWLIGKSSMEAKKRKEGQTATKNTASTIVKNIFHLIIGIILILVFAKLWFALVGKRD